MQHKCKIVCNFCGVKIILHQFNRVSACQFNVFFKCLNKCNIEPEALREQWCTEKPSCECNAIIHNTGLNASSRRSSWLIWDESVSPNCSRRVQGAERTGWKTGAENLAQSHTQTHTLKKKKSSALALCTVLEEMGEQRMLGVGSSQSAEADFRFQGAETTDWNSWRRFQIMRFSRCAALISSQRWVILGRRAPNFGKPHHTIAKDDAKIFSPSVFHHIFSTFPPAGESCRYKPGAEASLVSCVNANSYFCPTVNTFSLQRLQLREGGLFKGKG